jgi:hypothetical protein
MADTKPAGAGYYEASIADRYASMNNIPATLPYNTGRFFQPVGNKAGTAYGYRPQESASETAPRIGGKV